MADRDLGVSNGRKAPRPLIRGLVGGVGGAAALAATRYDALSKPGGPPILWEPLLLAAFFVSLAALGAGAALYWTGKKELREFEAAHSESRRADKLVADRTRIMAAVNAISDTLNNLTALKGSPALTEFIGRYKQIATDSIAAVTYLLQGGGDVAVRVMFAEYDEAQQSLVMDGSQLVALRGPEGKQWPLSDLRLDTHHVAVVNAAAAFLKEPVEYRQGDSETSSPEIVHLRSPDNPDHYVRLKVCTGQRVFGVVFVDMWGSTLLPRTDMHPILSVTRILAAGLAAVSP